MSATATRPVEVSPVRRAAVTATGALVALFLFGAAIRAIGVERPIDLPSWRECDLGSIARNYYREDMNLLYPRIDWRRDGPGFAEMEFPLYPWSVAVLYKVFGMHEMLARVLSFAISMVTMLAFFGLARRLLPPAGAIGACAFWALSPLVVLVAHSIQPEGLMLCAYVAATYAFVRWLDEPRWRHYFLSMACVALAILAKLPAAHLGILFAVLLVREKGFGYLRRARVWLFAAGALVPAALWYWHAAGFWREYGNSLGLSNEDHWLGRDFFTNPRFLAGIVGLDVWYVWTTPALVVVAYGLWRNRTNRVVVVASAWLVSILLYYVVAARTLSAFWASYYHVVAAAPAALLVGHGIAALVSARFSRKRLITITSIAGIAALLTGRVAAVLLPNLSPGVAGRFFEPPIGWLASGALLAALTAFSIWVLRDRGGTGGFPSWPAAAIALAAVCPMFVVEAGLIIDQNRVRTGEHLFSAAHLIAPAIEPGALIAASGGVCIGPTGRPAAADTPYMFYWTDHKGFAICKEKQSIETLRQVAARGARYYIAEKDAVRRTPGFEEELLREFPVVMDTEPAWLFQLQ